MVAGLSNMKMSNKSRKITRIIACGVFKPAIDYLRLEERYPHLRLTYLASKLHLKPQELERLLLREIVKAKKRNERIICLYGECFPDISEFCKRHGVLKVPGHYCYEMLLGAERFKELIDEMAGTYFLEEDLIINFEEYCMKPLELEDEEMRKQCFEQYKRLLYVRQPTDADLMPRASELADFLELSLEIRDADYSYLEGKLTKLI